jgi:hypothetical protein
MLSSRMVIEDNAWKVKHIRFQSILKTSMNLIVFHMTQWTSLARITVDIQ